MLEIINIINTISESNAIFYAFVVILIVISLITFYLLYLQNKEMSKMKKNNAIETANLEYKDDKKDMNQESEREEIKEEKGIEELKMNEIVDIGKNVIEVKEEPVQGNFGYVKPLLDNDDFNLEELSRELENKPTNKTIILTPYEEEQEKKAIISYDELISKSEYNEANEINEIKSEVNSVDVNQLDNFKSEESIIDRKKIDDRLDMFHYEHEEEFLESLIQLKSTID